MTKRRSLKALNVDPVMRQIVTRACKREENRRTRADGSTMDFALLVAEEARLAFEPVELDKDKASAQLALSKEVIEFVYATSDLKCLNHGVLRTTGPCGKCPVCKAKALEEKVQERNARLGWTLEPCPICDGSGCVKAKHRTAKVK